MSFHRCALHALFGQTIHRRAKTYDNVLLFSDGFDGYAYLYAQYGIQRITCENQIIKTFDLIFDQPVTNSTFILSSSNCTTWHNLNKNGRIR